MRVGQILKLYPYAEDFFSVLPVTPNPKVTVTEFLLGIEDEVLQDLGQGTEDLIKRFNEFMRQMEQVKKVVDPIRSITIIGGQDKCGNAEDVCLTIRAGEIICIVGPTGSGKSRLLADIEWLAQRDTPTGRNILVNDRIPDAEWRYSTQHKLVAQLSQNMNFVMDLTVSEFLQMHAESRMVQDIDTVISNVINHANRFAGEQFSTDTPVTSLSGGQSRALMIADTAYLSASPVVLIDEIENAGIDRQSALKLLVDKQKIVLMATHDPILALMGNRRLVINNGKISKILTTTDSERRNLTILEKLDQQLTNVRNALRYGESIDRLPETLIGLWGEKVI
ncbi:MAG: potA 2 [Firmicutes bacterium]|nr:potA 2 [Bacillota bacterium]